MNESLKFFVSRHKELDSIQKFIDYQLTEDNFISQYLPSEKNEENVVPTNNRYLLLTGESGIGKSTLLCKLAADLTEVRYFIGFYT
jgi:flagellar biosynthesis GTPase FlhF